MSILTHTRSLTVSHDHDLTIIIIILIEYIKQEGKGGHDMTIKVHESTDISF